jgi:hypothetical protein
VTFDVGALPYGLVAQAYVLANIAIALGYLCVPWLVLPYLDLRRRTVIAGAVFFVGCTGSHIDMVWDVLSGHAAHPQIGLFALAWHVVQAAGTWGFILFFRWDLARANAALVAARATAAEAVALTGGTGPQPADLTATLAALRTVNPPPDDDPAVAAAVGRLPGKGEWVKAAPAVAMFCGTTLIVTFVIVFAVLAVTGTPTDAFFRLINLFMNTLGTVATLATLSVALLHARRTLENRKIALAGQEEAHRAAEAATSAARGVNGELTARIVAAANRAAQDAAAQLQRERDDAANRLRSERGAAATDRRQYEGDRRNYEADRGAYEAHRAAYEAERREPGTEGGGGPAT